MFTSGASLAASAWNSTAVQVRACVCGSSPGGVYASMDVCTTSERLLEGIGTAIFLSTCRANTACTASVCTSEREEEKRENTDD